MPTTERNDDQRDDELLAIRCQLGEPAAFDELIARWHGPLWIYVRRLIREEETAREIVQDVWVRVIRGFPRLRDASKLRAWLFGIARRALMDSLRDQYARSIEVDLDVDELPIDTWTQDDEEDLQRLEQSLSRLPLIEREVLTLFYLEELSLIDIAEALNVPIGTVKSRLFRARRLLRQDLTTRGVPS